MANSSKYKLHNGPPKGGWTFDYAVHLKLHYAVFGPFYVFLYKIDGAFTPEGVILPDIVDTGPSVLGGEIVHDANGARVELPYFQYLDIGIRKDRGDPWIKVEIVPDNLFPPMYWFQDLSGTPANHVEAVMTKDDRTDYYGDLEYSINGQTNWTGQIPSNTCRFIRFKAKKKNGPAATHKFSYNVWLPVDGQSEPVEIDPDIQNPKT